MGRRPKDPNAIPPVKPAKKRVRLNAGMSHGNLYTPSQSVTDAVPSTDWSLRDWIREAGGPTIKQLIAHANQVWPLEKEWPEKTVYSWVSRGIPSREDALRIISALKLAASTRSRTLFQGLRLFDHAETFLFSRACLDAFRPPSFLELRQMVGADTITSDGLNDTRILDRVTPPPPAQMYGRDLDIVRVLTEIESYPLTVLHGETGIGKSSLIWATAQEARSPKYSMVAEYDWLTITPLTPVNDSAWQMRTLRNIAARFKWMEAIGASERDLTKAVAKHLSKESVLMVFDQVDSEEQLAALIAWLKPLLPEGQNSAGGRAVIISRQAPAADQHALHLPPVKPERMRDMWTAFDTAANKQSKKVEAPVRDLILKAAGGNPSILKLGGTLSLVAEAHHVISVFNRAGGLSVSNQINEIIYALVNKLSAPAQWLALAAARTGVDLTDDNLFELWETRSEDNNLEAFQAARDELIRHAIFTAARHRRETYFFAPTVRDVLMGDIKA